MGLVADIESLFAGLFGQKSSGSAARPTPGGHLRPGRNGGAAAAAAAGAARYPSAQPLPAPLHVAPPDGPHNGQNGGIVVDERGIRRFKINRLTPQEAAKIAARDNVANDDPFGDAFAAVSVGAIAKLSNAVPGAGLAVSIGAHEVMSGNGVTADQVLYNNAVVAQLATVIVAPPQDAPPSQVRAVNQLFVGGADPHVGSHRQED